MRPASPPPVFIPVTAQDAARAALRKKLIWISAAVVVAGVSAWLYKRSADPVGANQAFESAKTLFEAARYDQAILACNRAIGLEKSLTDAYMLRGRAHMALYDSTLAIADFTEAAKQQPRDPQILLERASAYLDEKNYPAVIADATAALALSPRLARAYNLRGRAIRASGDPQRAIAEFDHAVEIEPGPETYYERGATYQALNDHHRAIEDFSQAIAYGPDRPQTYYARAESERAIGEDQQAEADHQQGRRLDGR